MTAKNQYKNFQFNTKKKKDKKDYFFGIKSFVLLSVIQLKSIDNKIVAIAALVRET